MSKTSNPKPPGYNGTSGISAGIRALTKGHVGSNECPSRDRGRQERKLRNVRFKTYPWKKDVLNRFLLPPFYIFKFQKFCFWGQMTRHRHEPYFESRRYQVLLRSTSFLDMAKNCQGGDMTTKVRQATRSKSIEQIFLIQIRFILKHNWRNYLPR